MTQIIESFWENAFSDFHLIIDWTHIKIGYGILSIRSTLFHWNDWTNNIKNHNESTQWYSFFFFFSKLYFYVFFGLFFHSGSFKSIDTVPMGRTTTHNDGCQYQLAWSGTMEICMLLSYEHFVSKIDNRSICGRIKAVNYLFDTPISGNFHRLKLWPNNRKKKKKHFAYVWNKFQIHKRKKWTFADTLNKNLQQSHSSLSDWECWN